MRQKGLMEWYPVVLRYGGLTGCLVFVPAVWLLTNRLEPALIGMFMSMVGIGEGVDALREFTQTKPEPPSAITRSGVAEEKGS